jgi:hypothetical protein
MASLMLQNAEEQRAAGGLPCKNLYEGSRDPHIFYFLKAQKEGRPR